MSKFFGAGFARTDFVDLYGSECSIQESSLATEYAIWLGVDKGFDGNSGPRMHLSQGMVTSLIPLLEHFVKHGELPYAETSSPPIVEKD